MCSTVAGYRQSSGGGSGGLGGGSRCGRGGSGAGYTALRTQASSLSDSEPGTTTLAINIMDAIGYDPCCHRITTPPIIVEAVSL